MALMEKRNLPLWIISQQRFSGEVDFIMFFFYFETVIRSGKEMEDVSMELLGHPDGPAAAFFFPRFRKMEHLHRQAQSLTKTKLH